MQKLRLAITAALVTLAAFGAGCSAESDTAARFVYQCASGEQISVTYRDDSTALLTYRGAEHLLQIAVAASGARYLGGGLEWWNKGNEGYLSLVSADDDRNRQLEACSSSQTAG